MDSLKPNPSLSSRYSRNPLADCLNDGDDDNPEDGDLLVVGGVNETDDVGNFRAADGDARHGNDDDVQFRVEGSGNDNGNV